MYTAKSFRCYFPFLPFSILADWYCWWLLGENQFNVQFFSFFFWVLILFFMLLLLIKFIYFFINHFPESSYRIHIFCRFWLGILLLIHFSSLYDPGLKVVFYSPSSFLLFSLFIVVALGTETLLLQGKIDA